MSLLEEQIALDFALSPENSGYSWCMQDLLPPAIPVSELSKLHRKVFGDDLALKEASCGKACLVGVFSYDLEQSVSGKGFHCKARCRLMVMLLSLNLHMSMLGDLSSELFSNILFL